MYLVKYFILQLDVWFSKSDLSGAQQINISALETNQNWKQIKTGNKSKLATAAKDLVRMQNRDWNMKSENLFSTYI